MLRLVLFSLAAATVAPFVLTQIGLNHWLGVIGSPLAYTLGLAPTTLVVFFLVLILGRLATIRWYLPIVMTALIVTPLAGVPFYFNRIVDRSAADLAAGDMRKFTRPVNMKTLAIRRPVEARCDELCQRILLNGQVERLLYVSMPMFSSSVDPNTAAVSFRMERRDSCPMVELDTETREIRVYDDKGAVNERKPAEMMRLAMASGHCLIVEPSTLTGADVVLSRGSIMHGVSSTIVRWLVQDDILARGERVTMHVREDAAFRETYRRTIVLAEKMNPFVLASLSVNVLDLPSLVKRWTRVYFDGPEWSVFITEMVGVGLTPKPKT